MNSKAFVGCGKRTLQCDVVYHDNNLIPNRLLSLIVIWLKYNLQKKNSDKFFHMSHTSATFGISHEVKRYIFIFFFTVWEFMHRHILSHSRRWHTNYWSQYQVMEKRCKSIIANPAHSTVALLWFQHRACLIKRKHFMAGPGFSEACRGERMWITAQCSSTVLSRWLHLFWQALDCVWWWETAPGWRWAPVLQLTMWIMETRRSESMRQQTPTPINPSLKGSAAETPNIFHHGSHALQKRWLKHHGSNGPKCSIDSSFNILHFSCNGT